MKARNLWSDVIIGSRAILKTVGQKWLEGSSPSHSAKQGEMTMKATDIIWDTDNPEDDPVLPPPDLPTEIEIPDGMTDEDEISDYLSDVTGFCHKGFVLTD